LISYGVGITARALLSEPELASLEVVDISRDILRMSPSIVNGGGGPLADPRVRIHVEDGRYFLQITDRSYDVITGEPPPPAAAGVVNLYTQEYFSLLRSRLRPGGLVSYWLPVGQLAEREAKSIVAAFCAAFPDCSLWEGTPIDWIPARIARRVGAARRGGDPPALDAAGARGAPARDRYRDAGAARGSLPRRCRLSSWRGRTTSRRSSTTWPRRAPRWHAAEKTMARHYQP
jgi:spermidine synthase